MVCRRNCCADPRRENSRDALEIEPADFLARLGVARTPDWRRRAHGRRHSYGWASETWIGRATYRICPQSRSGCHAANRQQWRVAIRRVFTACVRRSARPDWRQEQVAMKLIGLLMIGMALATD